MLFHDIKQLASSLNSLAFQYSEHVFFSPQSALTTLTADIKWWILKGELSLPAGRVENCKWLVLAKQELVKRFASGFHKSEGNFHADTILTVN